jgi:hypothetical protein
MRYGGASATLASNAYCNLQLLRLRGALTSRGELALAAMAKRHSPALLAAIEAYGADQVTHQPYKHPCDYATHSY